MHPNIKRNCQHHKTRQGSSFGIWNRDALLTKETSPIEWDPITCVSCVDKTIAQQTSIDDV